MSDMSDIASQGGPAAGGSAPRGPYGQLDTRFDERLSCFWGRMRAEPRACFNPGLLRDLLAWCDEVRAQIDDPSRPDVLYIATASATPGVFNYGGDLSRFAELIRAGDREGLLRYAGACVEAVWSNASHMGRPNLKTIALVQGDALGGGFEAAISANVLIAERGSKMGLPEILFNLFPGMGALSFLGRKVGFAKAEEIILSGKVYLAEELRALGVVDVLAEPGEGEKAVEEYIRRDMCSRNGSIALRAARERVDPISREELDAVGEIWADAALRLGPKDLRMMERLVARQNGKSGPGESAGD